MIVRAIDTEGDWLFGKGRNDYKSKNDAIIQSIGTRLRSFLGDCFFATGEGIDWFNLLGSKNQLQLELAVRAVILNTSGVTGFVSSSVNLDRATRAITIQYTVNTIYSGQINIGDTSSISSFILTEDGDVLITEDGGGIMGG